jgi:transcriptional regulator with XRE-family HTH domain
MVDREPDVLMSHRAVRSAEEEEFTRRLGLSIREQRDAVGLTQDELANQAQLSRGSIANIERGMQSPQLYSLVLIAHALSCRLTDLVPESFARAEALPLSNESRAAVQRVLRQTHRRAANRS